MMKLYIRIVDGQPFEHPILEDNFIQAFPNVDVNNLPPEFAEFVRVQPPILGIYEKNQTVSYAFVDGVWTDVFSCEQMTSEEILELQNKTKTEWAEHGFPSWVFNETMCCFNAPIPRPTDGKRYRWDEATISWIEITV